MKEKIDYTERRRYERANVQNILLAVLNSDEPVTLGLIDNISLGGVKYTHELSMVHNDNPIHSIDLILDINSQMFDIPCEYAWNVEAKRETYPRSRNLRQCGIKFGRLTPNQIFLLRSLINRCTSLGTRSITSNVQIAYS